MRVKEKAYECLPVERRQHPHHNPQLWRRVC